MVEIRNVVFFELIVGESHCIFMDEWRVKYKVVKNGNMQKKRSKH
ncbi:hypothetical protein HanRHA438_Chr05g0235361 [Helianthus annuus]|nr:hypothetical protein HanRHA438_Chr05g0235361 [Helianthus annuus]